ncbi:hypothetical protein BpHYR1_025977 [Brachionus plicatilis]|uniref:Uncharacterized protein n=1 Tax=Brachionus plicatilis TaxID=10195 RepID=A0A3M7P8P8_BRAPC|nr:hypothetical protein BpHYR1_025977 [Brachionus plicatilis]
MNFKLPFLILLMSLCNHLMTNPSSSTIKSNKKFSRFNSRLKKINRFIKFVNRLESITNTKSKTHLLFGLHLVVLNVNLCTNQENLEMFSLKSIKIIFESITKIMMSIILAKLVQSFSLI